MPPVPLDKIVANVQFEMIGRPDPKVPPKTLWLTGYERSDLGPTLASRGARLVQDPHPGDEFLPAIRQHTRSPAAASSRTRSRATGSTRNITRRRTRHGAIDYAHMTEAIASMVEPLAWLANATFKPAWKPGMQPQRPGGSG